MQAAIRISPLQLRFVQRLICRLHQDASEYGASRSPVLLVSDDRLLAGFVLRIEDGARRPAGPAAVRAGRVGAGGRRPTDPVDVMPAAREPLRLGWRGPEQSDDEQSDGQTCAHRRSHFPYPAYDEAKLSLPPPIQPRAADTHLYRHRQNQLLVIPVHIVRRGADKQRDFFVYLFVRIITIGKASAGNVPAVVRRSWATAGR